MAKTTTKKTIVEQPVKVESVSANALFEGDNLPIIKSVGYHRLPNSNLYVAYILYIQGDKVVKVEAEEPVPFLFAEEQAKLNFVSNFMDKGDN